MATAPEIDATAEATLTPDDAGDVLDELIPAQNNSYALGLKLKVPQHEVESIHSDSTCSKPRDRLLRVIIEFLKQAQPVPTWKVIVDALRSPAVDLPQLANRVEAAHLSVSTSSHDVAMDKNASERVEPTPLSPDASTNDVVDEVSSSTDRPVSPVPNPMTIEYIKAKIKKLEKRFNKLKIESKKCLKRLKITTEQVADALISLPADDVDEHKQFLQSQMSGICGAASHSELIGTLSLNMNYLSYHLLEYVVNEFDLEVKKEMKSYKADLQRFREKTPLKLFCNAQKKRRVKPPPDFEELVAEFEWPDDVTLEVVEQFREEYACHYKLRECALLLNQVRPGSFIVSWFVPESITEKLKDNLPGELLKKYSVIKLDIAGSCVHRLRKHLTRSSQQSLTSEEASAEATSHGSNEEEYPFVKTPSDDFVCPVTYSLLLQPYLTTCCGKHLSQEVATRIQEEGGVCPLCKASEWSSVLNKHFQRQVKALDVLCRHEDRGCGWQGELSEFQRHVKSCPLKDEPSQLLLPRYDVKSHSEIQTQGQCSKKDVERKPLQSETSHMKYKLKPMKLSVQCHPVKPTLCAMNRGSATTDGQFAYFMSEKSNSIYAFEWMTEKWVEFAISPHRYSTLVIIDGELTTVGGQEIKGNCVTNQLLTLQEKEWVEEYPPMFIARSDTAVISSDDYIIVIGGTSGDWIDAVELFQLKTRQWYELKCIPKSLVRPSATLCGSQVYVTDGNIIYSCSLQALLSSNEPITPHTTPQLISWTSLPRLPVKQSTAANLCGQLVIIGGLQHFSMVNSIHQLVDREWVKIGDMSSGRRLCLVVSASHNKLMIVGGGAYNSVEECIVDM